MSVLTRSLFFSPAILLVELVYAVVGIAWLVQYYKPCSDVTAKNLALGEWNVDIKENEKGLSKRVLFE